MGTVRVEEALDVTGRQCGGCLSGGTHEGRVPDQDLVGAVAVADPRLVGLLAVPSPCAIRPVDLEHERVLPTGTDLRDAHGAPSPAIEAEQDRGGILGLD